MAPRRTSRRPAARRRAPPRRRARRRAPVAGRFVGRDASPILDRYPPKDPGLAPRGPPPPATPRDSGTSRPPAALPSPPPAAPSPGAALAAERPPPMLLSLERPFDIEEFSQQLGETVVEVTVPREQLAEVLRRAAEFMGFGIYVYEIFVRPSPSETLKGFVVRLQRVDFRPERGAWAAFEERGRSDSPFGPEGRR